MNETEQLLGSAVAVCPRCSNGLPTCLDTRPDGTRYSHDETCATRTWADDVCLDCQEDDRG